MSGNMARTRPHSSEALPAPVAPATRRWVPCSRTRQGAGLAAADRQRPEIRRDRDRERGDDGGEGVAADQFQHHPAGGGPDSAQVDAEAVRQVVSVFGDIGRGLPGDQPDGYPVGVPGG